MTNALEKMVVFRVGEDLFAASVQSVERVLRQQQARPVPDVPAWIDGVIEYRQRVVPVINLRRRFELPEMDARPEMRTLIMHAGDEWIAVTVDAVLEVTGAGEVTPPPPFFRGLAGEYMRGLVKRGDELVIALDVDRLLTATERLQIGAATGREDGGTGHG
ncbi:MAG: chemotaxis protein CheW [Gemmatimonadaceae bacterium]|nr:chemotaxis protein CheW [Gemmatimonadaceae bacterium]